MRGQTPPCFTFQSLARRSTGALGHVNKEIIATAMISLPISALLARLPLVPAIRAVGPRSAA